MKLTDTNILLIHLHPYSLTNPTDQPANQPCSGVIPEKLTVHTYT